MCFLWVCGVGRACPQIFIPLIWMKSKTNSERAPRAAQGSSDFLFAPEYNGWKNIYRLEQNKTMCYICFTKNKKKLKWKWILLDSQKSQTEKQKEKSLRCGRGRNYKMKLLLYWLQKQVMLSLTLKLLSTVCWGQFRVSDPLTQGRSHVTHDSQSSSKDRRNWTH